MDDPRRAEFAACELMIEMGFTDAMVTIQSRDGGFDVISTSAIAEVKWQAARTPPKDVRALNGVKGDRQALFFSRSGYSANAIEFASCHDIALFVFIATDESLEPANRIAKALWDPVLASRRAELKREEALANEADARRRAAEARKRERAEARASRRAERHESQKRKPAARQEAGGRRKAERAEANTIRRQARAERFQTERDRLEHARSERLRKRRARNEQYDRRVGSHFRRSMHLNLVCSILGTPLLVFVPVSIVWSLRLRRRLSSAGFRRSPWPLRFAIFLSAVTAFIIVAGLVTGVTTLAAGTDPATDVARAPWDIIGPVAGLVLAVALVLWLFASWTTASLAARRDASAADDRRPSHPPPPPPPAPRDRDRSTAETTRSGTTPHDSATSRY